MSATGRTNQAGPTTVRQEDDDYETPAWCVRAVWPHVRPISGIVLEPCAGRGAIVETLLDQSTSVIRGTQISNVLWLPDRLHARELDVDRAAKIPLPVGNKMCRDWLEHAETLQAQLIITNPPYKLALEFASKAIAIQQPHGGTTCMLLRLNFLGSQKRGQWLRDHLPDVYVLSRRPSFCTYVMSTTTGNEFNKLSGPAKRKRLAAVAPWWGALEAVKVGVPEELLEIASPPFDTGKIALAPSRVPAVQEWCARLPGWEGNPLVFKSGTDATEYAWFVWGPRARGRIHILEERS